MKILFLSQYVTIDGNPAFMRNRTGFGYMVRDIANSVGPLEQVDLLTVSGFTEDTHFDHIHLLPKSKWSTLAYIKFRYIGLWWTVSKQFNYSFKRKIQLLVYYASLGYVDHVVKLGGYDLVHIHGVGGITQGYENICHRHKIPYIVTLHGLNSFEESVRMEAAEKANERFFLDYSYKAGTIVTFISSGILRQAKEYLKVKHHPHFLVVPNGTDTKLLHQTLSVREKYNIPNDSYLIVYVGNISWCKNQIQTARAYSILPEEVKSRVKILYVGNENYAELSEYIRENNLSDHLICTGAVAKEEVHNYYIAADATIMTSLSEGFGLSIIEGFTYGKPSIIFDDLAAAEDLYDEKAMVLVHERTDDALAKGIQALMNHIWDSDEIKKYALKFSLENMAKAYVETYKKAIEG